MSDSVKNIRANVYLNDKTAGKTLRQLNSESRKLRNQLQHLPRDSKRFADASREFKKVRAELNKTNKELYAVDSGLSRLANGVNKYFTLATAGIAALTGVIFTIKNYISNSGELSDLRADVQKTTELTTDQMNDLQKQFDSMNTRTSRKELLELSAQAGKLGVRGVADLASFVEQANKINVALGEDLGADAVLKIGKMADIFQIDMERIGSGINKVADSSKASAPYLTEWLSRLGGIAKATEISAGDVLGYGATLDELGLKVEMSSTALNGFFADFLKNTESFGRAAGFANGELSKLIGEKGTNEGFLTFLERLKEGSSSSQDFMRKLEAVGISGDRGSQVFLALSQNLEKVRERQILANEEIATGTSITDEYNRKNETLQANLLKIGRYLRAKFINSKALKFMEDMAEAAAKYVRVPLSKQIEEERVEMRKLQLKLKDVRLEHGERIKIIDTLKERYPGYLGFIDSETISNEKLNEALKKVNEQLNNRRVLQEQQEEVDSAQDGVDRAKLKSEELLDRVRLQLAKVADEKGVDTSKMNLSDPRQVIHQARILFAQYGDEIDELWSDAHKLGQLAGEFSSHQKVIYAWEQQLNEALTERERRIKIIGAGLKETEENLATGGKSALEQKGAALAQRLGADANALLLEYYRSDYENFKSFETEKLKAAGLYIEEKSKLLDDAIVNQTDEQQKAQEQINQFLAQYNEDEIAQVKAKFEKMLALAEKHGLDRRALEAALNEELKQLNLNKAQEDYEEEQNRLKSLAESSLQQMWEYEQSQILEQAAIEELSQEALNERLYNAEIAHLERMLDARKTLGEETIELEKKIAEMRAGLTERKLSADEKERESITKSMFLTTAQGDGEADATSLVLNAIRERLKAYLAEYIAKSLITALGSGPLAAFTAPLIAAGAGALFSSFIPSFATGGYTGVGLGLKDPNLPNRNIAGFVHDDEYVVASEELRQPDIAQLVQVIENVRQARTGGGSPAKTNKAAKPISPATTKVSHSAEDRMLLRVNTGLLRLLEKLDKQGLKAVADQRFRRDMEVLQAEEEFIKSKSQL
tara:strand:- start:4572 stop:7736 length:3165 start_codon:yes stop_codon:yes gene_type:complete